MLAELHARHGLSVEDARVVHQHSNTAVALPAEGLLVRIAGGTGKKAAVQASVRVCRWLAGRDFPCVEPVQIEPLDAGGAVVSLWKLLDVVDEPRPTGADLGSIVRQLHAQPVLPVALAPLNDPLHSVSVAVREGTGGMSRTDADWLQDRIEHMRAVWAGLKAVLPQGLVHGDAHPGNLIRTREGRVVLGDWDHVAYGPREWDLVQIHYMARRFRRYDGDDVQVFTDAYGWDVTTWQGCEDLIAIRELSGLSPYIRRAAHESWAAEEIAYRVSCLRSGDRTTTWNSPRT
ncbi:phosphotransferase [Actinomadura adrarensis]|uniref:Phosphotransferase n=1 Tax=Actinomadura adrarensis TaxID=1819600 RepID=A0ABW3CTL2_9ACTN